MTQLTLPLASQPQADANVVVGDRVRHLDNEAFEGVVERVENGHAKVRVIAWSGPVLPPNPVTCRVDRLLVI